MNLFRVETHSVSHQLSNLETDFVMHIEVALMLVICWVLLVVDGG